MAKALKIDYFILTEQKNGRTLECGAEKVGGTENEQGKLYHLRVIDSVKGAMYYGDNVVGYALEMTAKEIREFIRRMMRLEFTYSN